MTAGVGNPEGRLGALPSTLGRHRQACRFRIGHRGWNRALVLKTSALLRLGCYPMIPCIMRSHDGSAFTR